jgi:osmotically-inducible protein OsmY
MAYDEQQTKKSRVVVETPNARREVTRTERDYSPDSGGTSAATIAIVVILAIGVVVLVVLLVMNKQANDETNANLAAQQAAQQPAQQPVIVQQPAPQQQPPIIVQQPAAPAAQQPIVINPPSGGSTASNVSEDSRAQTEIERRLQKDATLASLGITVSVVDGKALLIGTVSSDQLKQQAERLVRGVRGVKSVDNQILVS